MMFVLDTNVVSELRKVQIDKADLNLAAWAQSVDAADLFVSAITLMELELGVLSIERKDASQGAMLRSWLEQHVLPEFSRRTPWHCAAPDGMCPTSVASAMHSLRQLPLCTA